MYKPKVNYIGQKSKVEQIAQTIAMDIEKGVLERNAQLPSINEFSEENNVARDTIEKAYGMLRTQGYIVSVPGKGYFVKSKKDKRISVLLIFNKLSSYKKIIYESFIETLGDRAKVDLQIHHYNPALLQEILSTHLGNYHYYVIMPHFFLSAKKKEYMEILKAIPKDQLLLLDKTLPELKGQYMSVYQDFRQDILNALVEAAGYIEKYNRVVIVFPQHSNHPTEIIKGIREFCGLRGKAFEVIHSIQQQSLVKGTLYIIIAESDLATLIKTMRSQGWVLGREAGIISFNETILKELLDISVITTDFEEMGRTAANLIIERQYVKIKNPFKIIIRKSV